MKKGYKAAAAVVAAALFLGGCSASDPNAERKTEAESVTVGGMFSQQVDRNVTYVMKRAVGRRECRSDRQGYSRRLRHSGHRVDHH